MIKRKAEPSRRTCKNGHVYYKSTDCPVCPICEKERNAAGFISDLGAPARRALANAGIKSVEQLSEKTERDILKLHGMGPSSMPKLRAALKSNGLSFKK